MMHNHMECCAISVQTALDCQEGERIRGPKMRVYSVGFFVLWRSRKEWRHVADGSLYQLI